MPRPESTMAETANPDPLALLAPAKLNLFLEVLRKREDGYHDLETVMQEIDLCDELAFERRERGITLTCDDVRVPTDERNLVWRAASLLSDECGVQDGVAIHLRKRIPVGGGMGGGSSDAAATLKGLNRLWRLELSDEELRSFAARLGSDVAFFITGGTAVCHGRGEIVSSFRVPTPLTYVLLCPELSVSTASVYRRLRLDLTCRRESAKYLRDALTSANPDQIGRLLFNRLEEVTFQLYPALLGFREGLQKMGFCGTLMTGSGSALFGLCRGQTEAHAAQAKIERTNWGRVFVVTTMSR
ncbi:MAG: 4-(cytidine 5'-diphospho)-2-C-methyl-D-erythritol kinase [Planctomycetes bacterium]|nr:4-(cytidine 5'-diphospho)-2-C-methyl-D-erythritol kinase [Planctomycetota bacterium]